MLTNKTVLLGVTGGIAAYKMADVASSLVKLGANVHVIMTKNATNFIIRLLLKLLPHTSALLILLTVILISK